MVILLYPKNKLKKPKPNKQKNNQTNIFGYDKLIKELFGGFYTWNPCYVD